MLKIPSNEFKILNTDFNNFKTKISKTRKQDRTFFISQVNSFEKKYKKIGYERSFAKILFDFASEMQKNGIKDLPGIIYSSLMKMPFIRLKEKELYINKAIEYATEQGDYIHVFSRLVDLEKLYKKTKQSHKYTDILFKQEKVLIRICNDFKGAKRNYSTYKRKNCPLTKYQTELAKTRVDIAKMIIKSNPNLAKTVLEKARIVFGKVGKQKEIKFIDDILSQIKDFDAVL